MDEKLFSQFMWKSMFIFSQMREFLNHASSWVKQDKYYYRGKVRDFWPFNKKNLSYLCSRRHPLVQFRFMGCSEQPCYRGVFGLEHSHCLFLPDHLVCPASDQVSISKSGFQIASPPILFLFFSLHVFEDEEFCVSTGYSNLWCHSVLFAGGNVRGQYCHGQSE